MDKRYIMKTLIKYGVAAILVAVAAVWVVRQTRNSSISIGSDSNIGVTPQRITQIKQIRQWEFMEIVDEVAIDTIRHNDFFTDDRLTCIYHGSPRLGIDLGKAAGDWVTTSGDTVSVRLPRPSLLDERFIDEARTTVFCENGRWNAAAREAMLRRAREEMRAHALSPENIRQVMESARVRFSEIFLSLGAGHVVVTFE